MVWNLCDNAVKYGAPRDGHKLEIKLARLNPSYRPYLEVADRGTGSSPRSPIASSSHFSPVGRAAPGSGLFIAREFAQLNRAILLYEPRSGDGSIFRIVFSDPQRWEE